MKFQNPSMHNSKVSKKYYRRTYTQTDRQDKAICHSNFFIVGDNVLHGLVSFTGLNK